MEDTIVRLLDLYGIQGLYVVILFYIVRMANQSNPGETQRRLIGVLETQGTNAETLKKALEKHDISSSTRDEAFVLILNKSNAILDGLSTGQNTMIGALNTLLNKSGEMTRRLDGIQVKMTEKTELQVIQEQLGQVLAELKQLNTRWDALQPVPELIREFGVRLGTVEKIVPPLKEKVDKLVTNEVQAVVGTAPSGGASKSQARATSEQETAVVPPQESTDKPKTDVTPTGG